MSKGRPKKSVEIEYMCQNDKCKMKYKLPSWRTDGKKYCSLKCSHESKKGKSNTWSIIKPDKKICPNCEGIFLVGGEGRPNRNQIYCSNFCFHNHWGQQEFPNQMLNTEIAWFAGLFDGEGNICQPRGKKSGSLRIGISNNNKEILEKVLKITGTGSIINKKVYKEHHSPGFVWQCYGRNAREILKQVLPWLIVKREAAQGALNAYNNSIYTTRN